MARSLKSERESNGPGARSAKHLMEWQVIPLAVITAIGYNLTLPLTLLCPAGESLSAPQKLKNKWLWPLSRSNHILSRPSSACTRTPYREQ